MLRVTQIMENFTDNVDNLISTALEEARNKVLPNPKISAANKNKEIINVLYQKGIFNIKDSVLKISQLYEQMGFLLTICRKIGICKMKIDSTHHFC